MTNPAECLFCKIVAGEVQADVVHRDEAVTAFRDISPQAPVHLLLVPNEHVESISALRPEQDGLMGRLLRTAGQIAANEGVSENGYRVLSNCGRDAGQLVMHLHVHVLGGRQMGWPPG